MTNVNIQYYVEGDDEKKLVNVLKTQLKLIKPGKVQKFNAIQNHIPDAILRTLKSKTIVVIIFDTDTNSIDILNSNIKKLTACKAVSKIITIPQVPNLEAELIRSCNIKKITDLLNSKSKSEFKSDLIRISNLDIKLSEHQFDINLFWNQQPGTPYQNVINEAQEIKISKN